MDSALYFRKIIVALLNFQIDKFEFFVAYLTRVIPISQKISFFQIDKKFQPSKGELNRTSSRHTLKGRCGKDGVQNVVSM